jgi:CBASS immunity sensor of nucleotide second messenger signals
MTHEGLQSVVRKKKAKSTRPAKSNRGKSPSPETVREIWARSAGLCAFPGCGAALYEDRALLRPANLGEIAHNVSASKKGPRGDVKRSHQLSNNSRNLILLCRIHHRQVDEGDAEHYSEALLQSWKNAHERNVRMASALSGKAGAKPLVIRGPIGGQQSAVNNQAIARAMLDNYMPALADPAVIDLPEGAHADGTSDYWTAHANTIRDRLRLHHDGTADLAIFPLAEIPALICLGRLLGDKKPFALYQYDRHAKGWSFQKPAAPAADFTFTQIAPFKGAVALKLALTANIADERVIKAVGTEVPIIEFTTKSPSTDLVQSEATIVAFSRAIRKCLEMIERQGGVNVEIHVFPAMPAPLAVALGASVMPKVPNPLHVYDARGGQGAPFQKALALPLGVD